MALNGPYREAALGSIRWRIHAFLFVFLIPTQAFRAQTVTLNKTTEMANATACLFTYCLLVCPKCGNNVSRDAGIHVPVEDPGSCPGWYCIFKGWFIHSWEGGRTVPAVPPLLCWLTAWWCFHKEASCLQVKPAIMEQTKEKWNGEMIHGERKQKRIGKVMPSQTDNKIFICLSPKCTDRILHFVRV